MVLVKEHMGNPMYAHTCAYDDITFKCPMCGMTQQLTGGTLAWCLDCHADILDIGELIEDDEYRIKFHLGFIGYDGAEDTFDVNDEEKKCQ